MQIGIISEGHSDRAVIMNILVGLTGIDYTNIVSLRPTYRKDETDKAHNDPKTKSSYSVIQEECEERELIDGFLAIEGQDFIVLHIDTAEADRYGVNRPAKIEANYCENFRNLIIKKIESWLNKDLSNQILYAIAIEEIDAWVLTLYERSDSTKYVDAKKRLNRLLNQKGIKFIHDPFKYYWEISKDFSKNKNISNENIISRNCSLRLFSKEVEAKILPRLSSTNTV